MAVSTLKEGLSSDENDFSSVEDDTSSDEVNADATNLNTAYVSLPPVVLYPSIMDYSVLALQQHCQNQSGISEAKYFRRITLAVQMSNEAIHRPSPFPDKRQQDSAVRHTQLERRPHPDHPARDGLSLVDIEGSAAVSGTDAQGTASGIC